MDLEEDIERVSRNLSKLKVKTAQKFHSVLARSGQEILLYTTDGNIDHEYIKCFLEGIKEEILKNADFDELFCLFEEFLVRLKEAKMYKIYKRQILPDEIIILDKNKAKIIKDMMKAWV